MLLGCPRDEGNGNSQVLCPSCQKEGRMKQLTWYLKHHTINRVGIRAYWRFPTQHPGVRVRYALFRARHGVR